VGVEQIGVGAVGIALDLLGGGRFLASADVERLQDGARHRSNLARRFVARELDVVEPADVGGSRDVVTRRIDEDAHGRPVE
jgi:hypothetical protein